MATSTFEWYPGVRIYHSRNLSDWELVATPLNRPELLNMIGEPDSCGVWAPCLSWSDNKFWLCYTDVKRFDGNFKDTHNYLTTCTTIDGDWSDPVYLNSSGFDPSLYHAEDGKKWLLNMVWDHRTDRTSFGGVYLQEYSVPQKKLTGPIKNIFAGSELGLTEGPHLYKKNDYYYLMTAEGGTGYDHAVTLARSKNMDGPYELDPQNHVVTTKDAPDSPLQRAGHASMIETEEGEYWLAHLCSRPIANHQPKRGPMSRESALQKLEYTEDGWFRIVGGGPVPRTSWQQLADPVIANNAPDTEAHFDNPQLPKEFQWLRTPWPETWMSLEQRPGYLRLKGRESLGSLYQSALVARRQQHFDFNAETSVEFDPESFQQMAGLTYYYNSHKFHYLFICHDEDIGKYLGIMSCAGDQSLAVSFPIEQQKIPLGEGPVKLKVEVRGADLHFSFCQDHIWQRIEVTLDAAVISDEGGKGEGANFTGAFIGMCCQDMTGRQQAADFSYFHYKKI